MHFRPTVARIDLKALRHNVHEVRRRLPKNGGLLAVVKADAYGHGAVPVAKTLTECGVDALAVATVEEGIELRQAGIKSGKNQTDILVLQGFLGMGEEAAKVMLEHQLTPVIHSVSALSIWNTLNQKKSGKTTKPAPFHLQIDTGMTRLGVTPQALPNLLQTLQDCRNIRLEGVMSHLAWRENEEYTNYQLRLFQEMGEMIQQTAGPVAVWHLANSAAVLDGSPIALDWPGQYWVRPGIMLYGVPPYPAYAARAPLEPVMSLVSQIALIKHVPANTKVSYDCTYTTTRPSRLGVIPIGYADGYPFSASGRAQVLVAEQRVPVLGRVTMDLMVIDLTEVPQSQVGSEVVLLGKQGKERIDAGEIAAWSKTIAYEIVTRVSKRIPRVYC